MARPSNISYFLRQLEELGGVASNLTLRTQLDWPEDKYWKVHKEALDQELIAKGRGRGGTVILRTPESEAEVASIAENVAKHNASSITEILNDVLDDSEANTPTREIDLYEPVQSQLVLYLKRQKTLQECCSQITAQLGRRDTGGSWSRPDLVAIGIRAYEYLPDKTVEVYSFEIKASYDVTVKGVLEALSHRESATHSYAIFHTDGRDWEAYPEAQRIEQIASRYGIGVIVAADVSDADVWDERVPAVRSNADPEVLDRFIGNAMSAELKSQIRRWTR